MPWKTRNPAAADTAPEWLQPYCKQFIQRLADQGYTTATVRTYDGVVSLFCEEVARRGLRKGQLVGRTLSKAHAATLKAMHRNNYNQKIYCLVLLRHKFKGTRRAVEARQHGHRGKRLTRASMMRRRTVAIEFGTWRSGRNGGSSGSETVGYGKLRHPRGGTRS
jgi:hypothetical protein